MGLKLGSGDRAGTGLGGLETGLKCVDIIAGELVCNVVFTD